LIRTAEVRLRDGGAGDLDKVEPLWKILQGHHAEVGSRLTAVAEFRSGDESWRRSREHYERLLDPPDSFLLLAELGQETVGVALVHMRDSGATMDLAYPVPHLELLVVAPEQRGLGIGTVMLQEIASRAKAVSAVAVTVNVFAGNEAARRLYERLGFTQYFEVLIASADELARQTEHRS
jgi:GNAT superfamily N-acetyltransferase